MAPDIGAAGSGGSSSSLLPCEETRGSVSDGCGRAMVASGKLWDIPLTKVKVPGC